jgi:hypothetical protein
MNKNDAIDALTDLLARAIDALPITAFQIPAADAHAMIDAIPADFAQIADFLHDAFAENIPDFLDA